MAWISAFERDVTGGCLADGSAGAQGMPLTTRLDLVDGHDALEAALPFRVSGDACLQGGFDTESNALSGRYRLPASESPNWPAVAAASRSPSWHAYSQNSSSASRLCTTRMVQGRVNTLGSVIVAS